MTSEFKLRPIKLIVKVGVGVKTSRVAMSDAATHIAANDDLAYEARCLLAWADDDTEREPIAWDGHELFFHEHDVPEDATPTVVVYR